MEFVSTKIIMLFHLIDVITINYLTFSYDYARRFLIHANLMESFYPNLSILL